MAPQVGSNKRLPDLVETHGNGWSPPGRIRVERENPHAVVPASTVPIPYRGAVCGRTAPGLISRSGAFEGYKSPKSSKGRDGDQVGEAHTREGQIGWGFIVSVPCTLRIQELGV